MAQWRPLRNFNSSVHSLSSVKIGETILIEFHRAPIDFCEELSGNSRLLFTS